MAYQRMLFTYLLLVALVAIAALAAAPIGRTLDGALGTVEADRGGDTWRDASDFADGGSHTAGERCAVESTPFSDATTVASLSYPEQGVRRADDRTAALDALLRRE